MATDAAPDLKLKDIKFLRAIRDINASPDEYEGTEGGTVPATTTALRKSTALTKNEIDYRMVPSRSKLVEGGGCGYIRVHEPDQYRTDSGQLKFGPKSAELTEEGERALSEAMEKHGLTDRDTAETTQREQLAQMDTRLRELEEQVKEIETQVENLTNTVEDVVEFVQTWNESSTGALSEDKADAIEGLQSGVRDHDRVIRALGIDVAEEELDDPIAIRQQVRKTLRNAAEGESDPLQLSEKGN